jgi:AraC-like DNA-binding protein
LATHGINEIVTRLGDSNSWEARLDLVEQFVADRLSRAKLPETQIAWALGQIEAHKGMLTISTLCQQLGWSRRRLAETMRREFGLTPKTIARIARFQAAETMALSAQPPHWADIASACGFSDQAHLAREFSDLAGRSPTALFAAA